MHDLARINARRLQPLYDFVEVFSRGKDARAVKTPCYPLTSISGQLVLGEVVYVFVKQRSVKSNGRSSVFSHEEHPRTKDYLALAIVPPSVHHGNPLRIS